MRVQLVGVISLVPALLASCAAGDDSGAETVWKTTPVTNTVTVVSEVTVTGQVTEPPVETTRDAITCEVAIIGGGVGGLHTAFRLAPELGEGVCLFEKEDYLGGRIRDVALDPADPLSPRVGTGARRIMEGQNVLFDLADELSLTLETPAAAGDLIHARGGFAFAKEDLLPLYPSVQPQGGDTETALYDELRFGSFRANADDYPDFRSYIQDAVGIEEYNFLRDMSRFRADFESPLDAAGYLDYLDEEWDVCCEAQYPVGGMSTFVTGMEAGATTAGARVFLSDPVSDVHRVAAGFQLTTANHVVTATKVVIAAPPAAVDWMTGDVVEEIRAQQAYQDLLGVKVVTITQWWPTSWWEDIVNPGSGDPIWRAWTTDHCLNFIEIPQEPYLAAEHVTRSVYNDNLDCSQFWEAAAADGDAVVEAEIERGLLMIFDQNGLTMPTNVTIPDPLKTDVQVWEAGRHWLKAGATTTNAEVFDWATEPLAGEEVVLVGEAYNPQRSGWSDAAYKSSINALNTRYGMTLPGL